MLCVRLCIISFARLNLEYTQAIAVSNIRAETWANPLRFGCFSQYDNLYNQYVFDHLIDQTDMKIRCQTSPQSPPFIISIDNLG